jgi:hypothetical protein
MFNKSAKNRMNIQQQPTEGYCKINSNDQHKQQHQQQKLIQMNNDNNTSNLPNQQSKYFCPIKKEAEMNNNTQKVPNEPLNVYPHLTVTLDSNNVKERETKNDDLANISAISPNGHLYHKLLRLVSNSTDYSEAIASQMDTLLANPNIKSQLKKLHMQLLQDPDQYLKQLEHIQLTPSQKKQQQTSIINKKSSEIKKNEKRKENNIEDNEGRIEQDSEDIEQDLLDLREFYTNGNDFNLSLDELQTFGSKNMSYHSNNNNNGIIKKAEMMGSMNNNNNNHNFISNSIPRNVTRELRR